MPKSRFPFIDQLDGSPKSWGLLRDGLDLWWATDAADYAASHDSDGAAVAATTANNSLHLNGKVEAALSVLRATNANSASLLAGKAEVDLNVNSALTALTSNNALFLNGQPDTYYTNASNLATGTVPTARLGSGVANSSTFLAGDNTWTTVSLGSVPVANTTVNGTISTTTQSFAGVKTFTANVIIDETRPQAKFSWTGTTELSRIGRMTNSSTDVTHNLSHDGTHWNLDDTSLDGQLIRAIDSAPFEVWTAPAQSNPVSTITKLLSLTTAGVLTPTGGLSLGSTAMTTFEEGSFTPTAVPGSGSGITYSTQSGHYMRIHNWVFGVGRLTLSGKGTASGSLQIGGLPYTVRSSFWSPFSVPFFRNLLTSVVMFGGYCNAGTTNVVLTRMTAAGTDSTTPLQVSDVNTTFDIIFNFHYQV